MKTKESRRGLLLDSELLEVLKLWKQIESVRGAARFDLILRVSVPSR